MPAPPVRLLTTILSPLHFSTCLASKPRRDVHAAAGRIDHRVFDRAGREVFGLELGEIGLRVTALGRGGRGKQGSKQRESDCTFHEFPPVFFGLRRNIKATRTALATSISAVPGRWTKIIAPSGDIAKD